MERILIQIVDILVGVVWIVLVLNALLSFMPLEPWHPLRRALSDIANPIVQPFRNIIPPIGMMDLSPIVALIVIQILGELIKAMIRAAF